MVEWTLPIIIAIIFSTISIAVILSIGCYVFYICQKPKIYSSNAKLKNFISNHVKVLGEKYYPPPLYFGGRMQTFMGVFQREIKPKFLPYDRHIVTLEDGGQLALDILDKEVEETGEETCISNNLKEIEPLYKDNKPLIVLLLPGLTSCSQECYMKTLALAVTRAGAIAVALNNRGMGGVDIKTPRLFSASNCEDLAEVIEYLHKTFPQHKLMAVGTSMGGMQLSHYMIKYSEKAKQRLIAGIVISVVWDTKDGLMNLENGFLNKHVVNRAITGNLVYFAKTFRKDLECRDCWDFDKIINSKTVYQFDDRFTGPQFGFPNAEAYYAYSKISGQTHKFPIPVFALSAADDPLQPGQYLPKDEAEASGSNLVLIVTKYGGHVGFLEGVLPVKRRINYLERVVSEIVQAIRNNELLS